MHSTTSENNSANNSVRMKRICIVIPLAVIPRLPGVAALLRVAWIERRDFESTKNAQFLTALFP
jgi:hypothetical protein